MTVELPCWLCGIPTTDRSPTNGPSSPWHVKCADQAACELRYKERDKRLNREAREGKR